MAGVELVREGNRVTSREPRQMRMEVRIVVRYVQAENFEDAKDRARVFARQHVVGLSAYAGREADGSYTVEFR